MVDEHGRNLYSLAFRMVGNQHDAEEVVQEAFMKAWRNLDNFDGKSKISTWLYRIATNCALDLLRGRGRYEGRQAEVEDMNQTPSKQSGAESKVYADQMNQKVREALDDLAPKERSAFVLRHFEEHTIAEISQIMSMNPNAVKQAIFRAVRKLRGVLQTGAAS